MGQLATLDVSWITPVGAILNRCSNIAVSPQVMAAKKKLVYVLYVYMYGHAQLSLSCNLMRRLEP